MRVLCDATPKLPNVEKHNAEKKKERKKEEKEGQQVIPIQRFRADSEDEEVVYQTYMPKRYSSSPEKRVFLETVVYGTILMRTWPTCTYHTEIL